MGKIRFIIRSYPPGCLKQTTPKNASQLDDEQRPTGLNTAMAYISQVFIVPRDKTRLLGQWMRQVPRISPIQWLADSILD